MKPSEENMSHEIKELSSLYQGVYEKIADLKHIIYSATSLSELEPLAVLMSKSIKKLIKLSDNSVWLTSDPDTAYETAHNGKLIDPDLRQNLDIESSDTLKHILKQKRVVWSEGSEKIKTLFPEFTEPRIFSIKEKSRVFGFLLINKVPDDKQDLIQFLTQYFGMIFSMSCLHQEVLNQKKEMREMTDILFEQNSQITTLYNMGFKISKSLDTTQLCRLTTETVVNELGAEKAAVFILDKNSNQLVCESGSGEIIGIENLRFNFDKTDPMREAMESGRIVSHKDFAPELVLGPNCFKDWIIIPIKVMKNTLGVLVAEIGEMDIVDPISIMVNYVGLMLDRLMAMEDLAYANVELEKISTIDHLTGLYNHRYFQDQFKTEFSRTKRHGYALALLIIDLDHFKSVNDKLGHATGDQVLKEVAHRIGKLLRAVDILTRYGGDEIAVILPDTNKEFAMIVAERIRMEICSEPVLSGEESIKTSVSIGVAAVPSPMIESPEDLFRIADQALYRAKKAGRNRVMAAKEKKK